MFCCVLWKRGPHGQSLTAQLEKFQVTVEGPESTEDAINWADLLLVTGTTLVNGTTGEFPGRKPMLFYGTTIAGAAHLMKWDRFCYRST
ncbi:MAG: hypothetical protein JRI58_14545 [Deltaproteobacteria bacterium]|nr:hypothetical protein [Deltaproteobacteria bacterium]